MDNKHLIFIVNEFSRKGKKTTPQLKQIMALHNSTYEIHLTQYPKHATVLAEKLSADAGDNDRIVAVGGDGTLNEVVKGLLNVQRNLPVAYVPTGSGNDFARSLNLPMTLKESVQRILEIEKPKPLDVVIGKSDTDNIIAVNSIGFGLDGMVINKIDQTKNKQTIGKFSYLASVLSAYFSQKTFPLRLVTEDHTFTYRESLLVVCANNKFFGGGIPIHPHAVATDGMIDLVVAEKVTFRELLAILTSVMTTQNHLNHNKLHSHRVSSCSLILYTPQYGQRDGELIDKNIQKMSVDVIERLFWL